MTLEKKIAMTQMSCVWTGIGGCHNSSERRSRPSAVIRRRNNVFMIGLSFFVAACWSVAHADTPDVSSTASLDAAIQQEQRLLSTTRPVGATTEPTPPQSSAGSAAAEAQAEITRLETAIADENKSFDAAVSNLTNHIERKTTELSQAKDDKERSAIQDQLFALATRKFNLVAEHKTQLAALRQQLDDASDRLKRAEREKSLANIPVDPRVTPAMIAEHRARLLADARGDDIKEQTLLGQINSLRYQLRTKTAYDPRETQARLQQIQAELFKVQNTRKAQQADRVKAVEQRSDHELAIELSTTLREQDEAVARQRAEEQESAEAAKREAAARLAKWNQKYQNWDGFTRTCPVCNGTGHSESSRDKTQQNLGPYMAMGAATGGFMRIRGAIEYCELCFGVGKVPDYDR